MQGFLILHAIGCLVAADERTYMKKYISPALIFLLPILILGGCKGHAPLPRKNNISGPGGDTTLTQYIKPPSGFSDTLVIATTAAVFFKPDSLQLEKIRAIRKKNEYETEVHNCYFLMRNARMVLRQYWPRVNMIDATRVRYLLFVKQDNSQVCIDLDQKGDSCGIFLFDKKKQPVFTDMMNIDTDLGFYFGKKE